MTTEQDSADTIGSDWEARAVARRHIRTAFAAINEHAHGDEVQGDLLAEAQKSLAQARLYLDAIEAITDPGFPALGGRGAEE